MINIANKLICLSLNSHWQPIGYKTVKDAIVNLCGSQINPKPTVMALDIDYTVDEFNVPLYNEPISIIPRSWSEWITLPVRSWELSISSPNLEIRIPTVIIAINFGKMPLRQFRSKPSKEAIYHRDNGTCQYSGKKINKDHATVDHIIPKSKGGADTWSNLVLCRRDINSKKGNKLNSEVGLKLLKYPEEPNPVPASNLIKDIRHIDWQHFIKK